MKHEQILELILFCALRLQIFLTTKTTTSALLMILYYWAAKCFLFFANKQITEYYVYSVGKKKKERIQSDSDLTVKLIEELTFTRLQLFMKRLADIHFSKEHYVPVN